MVLFVVLGGVVPGYGWYAVVCYPFLSIAAGRMLRDLLQSPRFLELFLFAITALLSSLHLWHMNSLELPFTTPWGGAVFVLLFFPLLISYAFESDTAVFCRKMLAYSFVGGFFVLNVLIVSDFLYISSKL